MFKALKLTQENKATKGQFVEMDESELPPGDVIVRVEYSSLNYKDALAVTGRGAIVRNWPMVPGIDLAGVVETSQHPDWKPGDRVVVNGWGMGESAWGGLAQKASLKADWLLRLPASYTTRQAMAIATAGYTAALCVMALQKHGLKPGDGEVLVTGAAGGVGSVAVALLGGLGYTVTASTGRPLEAEYLRFMGAEHILDRSALSTPGRPLQSERWAGVVDTVGSHTLANALAQTKWNGAVAACGLAGWQRPAGHRDALHPARRHAARHQLRLPAERGARAGLGAARGARARRAAGPDDARGGLERHRAGQQRPAGRAASAGRTVVDVNR
jgi:acrylyl-CoA reductase (NADPH)